MKPGTPIHGLDIFKDKDPPVALPRSEYPEWVNDLAQPLPSLAKLRRTNILEADEKDQKRYFKLTRRIKIKQNSLVKSK
jgi:Mitochondrial ribosomal protein L37